MYSCTRAVADRLLSDGDLDVVSGDAATTAVCLSDGCRDRGLHVLLVLIPVDVAKRRV